MERWRAASFLRLVFLFVFYAQLLIAACIAVALRLAVPVTGMPSAVLAAVLVAGALAQFPLAIASTLGLARVASRQQALSRALFMGVILSTTAWFGAFAVATGQDALATYALFALVLAGYALGFVMIGRLAARAAELPPVLAREAGSEATELT